MAGGKRGRTELSEAEKEERRLAKLAEQGTKRKYTRKNEVSSNSSNTTSSSTDSNDTKMGDNNSNTNNTSGEHIEGGGGDKNVVNDQNTNLNDQNQNTNTNTGGGEGGGENNLSDGAKFQPNKLWKPFAGDRIKRSYATPEINPELLNTEIPEVNINTGGNQMSSENADKLLTKP